MYHRGGHFPQPCSCGATLARDPPEGPKRTPFVFNTVLVPRVLASLQLTSPDFSGIHGSDACLFQVVKLAGIVREYWNIDTWTPYPKKELCVRGNCFWATSFGSDLLALRVIKMGVWKPWSSLPGNHKAWFIGVPTGRRFGDFLKENPLLGWLSLGSFLRNSQAIESGSG